jgi:hypothetical protein
MDFKIEKKSLRSGEVGAGINQDEHVVVVWNASGVLRATFLEKKDIDELFRNGGRLDLLIRNRNSVLPEKRIFRDL